MGKVEWLKASAKKAYHYYKRNGLHAAFSAIVERLLQETGEKYVYEAPAEEVLAAQRAEASGWMAECTAPLLSVVVPTYETPEKYLIELLDSMKNQTYPNWELILADASRSERVSEVLKRYTENGNCKGKDQGPCHSENSQYMGQIRYIRLSENRGISCNTNEAIRAARGEYIGLLDHDDFLTPDALFEMALAVRNSRIGGLSPVFLYSDEDKCDGDGKEFYEPHLKLDFNPDMLLTNNYVCHFTMMEAGTLKKLQLRPEFDGAQDFDLVLRASADVFSGVKENVFVHIPKVLYHWRCHMDSTAANPESKRYAYEAGKRALEDLARKQGWQVEVDDTRHLGFYELRWNPSALQQRSDIGAAAGPLPSVKGKMISGIYDIENVSGNSGTAGDIMKSTSVTMRYEGLKKGFGGYLHRAELAQNVEAADVRTLQVKPQYENELQKALQQIRDGADPVKVSIDFCCRIRKDGLRIVWIP